MNQPTQPNPEPAPPPAAAVPLPFKGRPYRTMTESCMPKDTAQLYWVPPVECELQGLVLSDDKLSVEFVVIGRERLSLEQAKGRKVNPQIHVTTIVLNGGDFPVAATGAWLVTGAMLPAEDPEIPRPAPTAPATPAMPQAPPGFFGPAEGSFPAEAPPQPIQSLGAPAVRQPPEHQNASGALPPPQQAWTGVTQGQAGALAAPVPVVNATGSRVGPPPVISPPPTPGVIMGIPPQTATFGRPAPAQGTAYAEPPSNELTVYLTRDEVMRLYELAREPTFNAMEKSSIVRKLESVL